MFIYPLGIRSFISFYEKKSSWHQDRSCISEKIVLNHAVFMVSFFWPWIRKEEIQLIHFSLCKYLGYFLSKNFQQDDIISPLTSRFFVGTNESFIFEFYSNTGHVWAISSIVTKKISHTRPYLKHQFFFSEKLFPLALFRTHNILIRVDMRMFSDFLDVDILVRHGADCREVPNKSREHVKAVSLNSKKTDYNIRARSYFNLFYYEYLKRPNHRRDKSIFPKSLRMDGTRSRTLWCDCFLYSDKCYYI